MLVVGQVEGNNNSALMSQQEDEQLAFTVATVWREERVSCPHPDILRGYETKSLESGAMEFIAFRLRESQCPYCSAVLEDIRVRDEEVSQPKLEDLRDRLMRSTAAALKKASGQG